MDAITLITENLDVEKLLNYYDFDHINSNGEIIRACCKLHGGNNPSAFVINKETGLWYCHTGNCGGGDVFTLVQKMEGFNDFPSTVRWVANFFNIDISNLTITERKINYIIDLRNFIKMMKNHKKKEIQPFYIQEEIKSVTKFRNFKLDTINHFQLGYVDKVKLQKRTGEDYILYNRLVFPIIFDNIQIGISFRRIKHNDIPKWSHQPALTDFGNILYNYDECKTKPSIVICEGITDVWAYHEINVPAVATFGAHITKEQYNLLLKTGADLIFSFDGDEAGQEATKKAFKMFKNKANLSYITFNTIEDPESIQREVLYVRYNNRKKNQYFQR